jgi:hypothetical protein
MSKHYRSQEKGRVSISKGGAMDKKANVSNQKGMGSQSGNQLPKGRGNSLSKEAGSRASGKDMAQYADVKKGRREDFGKGDGSR